MERALLLVLLVASGGEAFAVEAPRGWYLGVGGGVSRLSPDTGGSDFSLENGRQRMRAALEGLLVS